MDSNRLVVGVVAHVDAGKTTLAERILYETGVIRKQGRVDHQDAFLDTDAMEKARGITIFSKQACFALGDYEITLMDTPGHVDFSAEMERTLQVLDYAVLVISGADGVQGHVETLWRLLSRYEIPVFLFINKMDQDGTDAEKLISELQTRLDGRCVDFSPLHGAYDAEGNVRLKAPASPEDVSEEFWENLAVCDEGLMERYLEGEAVTQQDIQLLVAQRKVFPCFFGSALKGFGVTELLDGLESYMMPSVYPETFGARVFKITRDGQGNRLTHMKITGGSLKAKTLLTNRRDGAETEEIWEEKADQLRIYSGAAFKPAGEAQAGMICAVTGLTKTFAGQGLGAEPEPLLPVLEPVLTYQIVLPWDCDVHGMYNKLKELEEEVPELSVVWQEESRQIHAQVMGEVQIEILKNMIRERYGVSAEFGTGSIVYKETIVNTVEGVGHFEPLRHYAEVHLLLEPLPPGEGLQFDSVCSEDVLDKNWQRLVLTHLEEKKHRGVLVGAQITDMKVTLVTGRAHLKHTQGGDFREATYRALRHGLKKAQSVLLEPVYSFRLELPSENVGRAMTDVQKMNGTCQPPQIEGEFSVLTGSAPVSAMGGYQKEVTAYTKGRGKLTCTLQGYAPCHDAEAVIAASGYDSEADLANPTGSVFCAHGAGFVVSWDQVEDYMHLESWLKPKLTEEEALELAAKELEAAHNAKARREVALPEGVTNEELEEIFSRTFSANKKERAGYKKKRVVRQTATKRWSYPDRPGSGVSVNGRNGQNNAADGQNGRNGAADGQSGRSGAIAGGQNGRSGAATGGQSAASAGQRAHYYRNKKAQDETEQYLLVDGYNIIFSWEDLRELAKINIESARNRLMDVLSNYQGFHRCVVILVFDAYRVEGGQGSVQKYHNIDVVFTKEAETADQYIEKTAHRLGRNHQVTVATSDALEQVIIYGQGARRLSARELLEEVELTKKQIREVWRQKHSDTKNYLFDHLPEDMAEMMEDVRLGKAEWQGQDPEQKK